MPRRPLRGLAAASRAWAVIITYGTDSVDESESPNEEAAANWDLASDRLREAAQHATAALKHEGWL